MRWIPRRAGRAREHGERGRGRGELSIDDLAARVAASAANPKIARTGAYEGPPSDIGEADVDVACRYVTDHLDGDPEVIDVEYLGEVDGKPVYHVTYEYDDPGAPEPAPSRLDAAKIARLRARRAARTTLPPRT